MVNTDGKERVLIAGKILGTSPLGLAVSGAVGIPADEILKMKYTDGGKGGFDPHARIKDMDLDGIDAAILYPTLGLFLGAIPEPDLAAAVYRSYNRWIADYCKPYPDRLFGVAMLPLQSIELAVEEFRFARHTLGLRSEGTGASGVKAVGVDRVRGQPAQHIVSHWMVPWLDRMDRHFDRKGIFDDSALKIRPSDYFRRQCWISFEPAEGTIAHAAEYLGATKLLWATDYPHHDGWFPGAPQMIAKKLPDAVRRQVLAQGAIDYYKLN